MKKIFAIILIVFLAGCIKDSDKNFSKILIDNGDRLIKINVEIADDNLERENGLMFRERLDEGSGMFFVFDDEEYRPFWMKNTLIPLDIIFIGESLEIVDIEYAEPCKADPCKVYKSQKPAKYVLEVNGNFTIRNGAKIGDKVILE